MEESLRAKCTLPRSGRLIKSAAFGVVLSSRGENSVRRSSRWVSLSALLCQPRKGMQPVRFGFTVGKANAHRGIDRVLVKRILRESARHIKPELERNGLSADIVLRLKCRLPDLGQAVSVRSFKSELREDCDQLLKRFSGQMQKDRQNV